MNRYSFLCLASAAVLTGCSSVSTTRDFDESFNFSTLKTFAWQHGSQPLTGNPKIDNDLNDKRIRDAVETNLRAKGFVKVDKAEADCRVAYFMNFQQRIDGSGSTISFGLGTGSVGRAGGVGWSSGNTISDYEEAQLIIDIINPADNEMIWRGQGERRAYSSSNPEKITDAVNDAVTRILKKFPPKQKAH
ncbi:DUF4136 domain-containing protein [Pontiellaceae bacterium B12219]|nr:DUF4136 domain-containing protein [Pontiellaceae bacterium B12219]